MRYGLAGVVTLMIAAGTMTGCSSSTTPGRQTDRDAGGRDSSAEAEAAPAAACTIGGTRYVSGTPNPANACEICQAIASTTAWTSLTDGTACAGIGVCQSGSCAPGCEVADVFYPANAVEPGNPCQSCKPGTSPNGWANLPDGTVCGDGQSCSGGTCGAPCDIDGILYTSGTQNPADACQFCSPTDDPDDWSNLGDGTSCGSGEVCIQGVCTPGCFIAGAIVQGGVVNSSDSCEICEPTASTTGWSDKANGTSCGGGKLCLGGSCTLGCQINGGTWPATVLNPANACQSCQPATSTTSWSDVPDGTACGTGVVCEDGTCDVDGGTAPDGGPRSDAGPKPDAAPRSDAGAKTDAAAKPDAGPRLDGSADAVAPRDAVRADAVARADGG
jgi:hypothetical protein